MKKIVAFLMMVVTVFTFSSETNSKRIKNITAITEGTGMGEKVTTLIIEMDKDINAKLLAKDAFIVENRDISRIYTNTKPEKSETGVDGKFIIIELSNKDAVATTRTRIFYADKTKISLVQNKDITLVNGEKYKKPLNNEILVNNKLKRVGIEDFEQHEYYDSKTGVTLKYNLYIPKNYKKSEKYPLVLFMHDAGPLSENTEMTLMQGNGATSWVSDKIQKEYPSFVVAPQYPVQVVNDEHKATTHLEATKNLLEYLTSKYSIDKNRLYTTGQSMGGMMSLALNSKYPDLFAASYYVACQWDPAVMATAAKNKAWIMVSTGDAKAYPGMNAITKVFEENGGVVARAESFRGDLSTEELNKKVEEMIKNNPNANVYYTTFQEGTIPYRPAGNKGAEHVYTWTIAYNIDAIKEWIFKQSK